MKLINVVLFFSFLFLQAIAFGQFFENTGRNCAATTYDQLLNKNEKYRSLNKKSEAFFLAKNAIFYDDDGNCLEEKVLQVAIHYIGVTDKEINKWYDKDSVYYENINIKPACFGFEIATKNHPKGFDLIEGSPAITINKYAKPFAAEFKNYFNIFVQKIDGGILGYSPLGGLPIGDGIVININAFGGINPCGELNNNPYYNLGRTVTHEAGHYFYLDHTFEKGCSTINDNIEDTPAVETPNSGCPQNKFSCGSKDLVINFMDYTNDDCMYMFTAMQTQVMNDYVFTMLKPMWETNNNEEQTTVLIGDTTIDISEIDTILNIPIDTIQEVYNELPIEQGGTEKVMTLLSKMIMFLSVLLFLLIVLYFFLRFKVK